jgi:hypothetical protein
LSFSAGTASFEVYRGTSPSQLYLIATNQQLANQFTDTGLPIQLIAPVDPNFDHANFYWRMEQQPEVSATLFSPTMIGSTTLSMAPNGYQGMVARITRGAGADQERAIVGNDATTLTVSPPWDINPTTSSFFVVAEAGWHFGAQTTSSPVDFVIPNLSGEVVQVTGRSANVNDVECDPRLSTVTRWQIDGSGTADSSAPPRPQFGLNAGQAGGSIELNGVSFTDLSNTKSVSSGTLTLYYWDELQAKPSLSLAASITPTDKTLNLTEAGPAQPNSVIELDSELISVTNTLNNGLEYQVTRGVNGSTAAAHIAGTTVYQLEVKTVIAPFPSEFFGSPYSGSWSYLLPFPDARVASGELFVTNNKGSSPSTAVCLTGLSGGGLRTLSGGQYSIQVSGYLAISQNAAPALVVDTSHSVRDIFGVLGRAADAPVQIRINVNGAAYCSLSFSPGQVVSDSVDGSTLPPLIADQQVTLSIISVGQTYPGSDLTLLIRL